MNLTMKNTRINSKGTGERELKLRRDLKLTFNSALEKRVLNIIFSDVKENQYEGTYIEQIKTRLEEIMHGCQTGTVSQLISYTQTEKWFNLYKKETIAVLNDSIGYGLFEIKFDEENYNNYIELGTERYIVVDEQISQKIFDTHQKNTLAWFSFEEVSHRIKNYIEQL